MSRFFLLLLLLVFSLVSISAVTVTGKVATIHGTVRDTGGKPLAGVVVVSAEGGLSARATTDAAGAFTLVEQPLCALHLIAASANGGGLAICAEQQTEVNITCAASLVARPSDIKLAQQLLETDSKLSEQNRLYDHADTINLIAGYDLAAAVRLAMADEKMPDGLRAFLLGKQAEAAPDKIADILVQLKMIGDSNCKLYAVIEMGIAASKTDRELAEQLYQLAKGIYDQSKHDQYNSLKHYAGLGYFTDIGLRMIAFAGVMHKTADVDAFLSYWHAQCKATPSRQWVIVQPIMEAAGRVNLEFAGKVADVFAEQSTSLYRLSFAMPNLAQHDPSAVPRLVKMLTVNKPGDTPLMNIFVFIDALGKKVRPRRCRWHRRWHRGKRDRKASGTCWKSQPTNRRRRSRQFCGIFSLGQITGTSRTLPGQTLLTRCSPRAFMPNTDSNRQTNLLNRCTPISSAASIRPRRGSFWKADIPCR